MPGRLKDLTLELLDEVPEPCRSCAFWQTTTGGRGGVPPDQPAKDAWWQATQLEWGIPGKAVLDQDQVVGYATFAPPALVPRARVLGPVPSEDAVLLAVVWVRPDHRGGGIGKQLVQAACREGIARGARAVEAFAHPGADGTTCGCGLPAGFLEATGFSLRRAHLEAPLYRLDLQSTVSWKKLADRALGDVVALLRRRERARQPAQPTSPHP